MAGFNEGGHAIHARDAERAPASWHGKNCSAQGLTKAGGAPDYNTCRAEPSRAEPSRAEPSRAEPSRETPPRGSRVCPAPHPGADTIFV